LQFRNQSKVETKGIELQAVGKWENGYSGRISYSYQVVKNLDTGVLMNNSPRTLLKAALTAPLPAGKTFATLETCYTGSSTNSTQQTVAGAAVVNLTVLNRDLIKGLELSGSVYNLFDTKYAVPAAGEYTNSLGEQLQSIVQDGISFRLKIGYRF
jgi:iron complex outermembrane receptor protein